MQDRRTRRTIGILWYPGAQAAAVYGLRDLFDAADRLHAGRPTPPPRLEVQQWHAEGGLTRPDDPLDALVVPPSLVGSEVPDHGRPLAAWIAGRHREGTTLCSACVGSFLLAETGLLAGRPATTHWALRDQFAARFPDVILDTDRLVIDDGDIITAGGVMAWVDLGLRIVERFLGPAAMLTTARYLLVDPGGREQRFYSTFAPTLTHGDAAVLRAQHWLRSQAHRKVTLTMMAARAGLGERTFIRRFHKATGLRPTEYVQQLRVGKARETLETSNLTVDEVAYRVGYEDPGAFRKVFLRWMGLSPGEYRRRFAVRR